METIIVQVSQISDRFAKPGSIGAAATQLKLCLQQVRLRQRQFVITIFLL